MNGGLDSFIFAMRVNSIAMDLGLGRLRTGSGCSKLTEKGICEQPARVTPQCSKKMLFFQTAKYISNKILLLHILTTTKTESL